MVVSKGTVHDYDSGLEISICAGRGDFSVERGRLILRPSVSFARLVGVARFWTNRPWNLWLPRSLGKGLYDSGVGAVLGRNQRRRLVYDPITK